jgi:hypothetical protein
MSDNIHIVELSVYTQPEIVEDNRNEWIEYHTPDGNDYYKWLIDRYRNSPTNSAVITNISRLMYGRGLYAKNASRKANNLAQVLSLISKETLRCVVLDYKLFGSAAFQVIYNNNRTKIVEVYHMPMNLLRPEKCNKDGEIEAYYYSDNWEDTKKFPPKRVDAFGFSKKGIEVLVFGNYAVGRKYFASVDYEGALDYCVLEQEIAQYLVNDVKNGFSGTKVINFNNGVPGEDQQRLIVNKTMSKFTGSTGEKLIIAFNDDETKKTTVDDIPLNDAPEHYQYLSEEARNKILYCHNVTSPMLVGISPDGQGFSSNADEIETASKYFYNTVIKSLQEPILDAIDKIINFNGMVLDLYFRRLNLFEDLDEKQQVEEETQLSKQNVIEDIISQFGEDEDLEGWDLVDEREVVYEDDDALDQQLKDYFTEKETVLSKLWRFATGIASPNKQSAQDKELDGFYFKVRYQYTGNPSPERNFCKAMMRARKVYRKEDIIRMGQQVVNSGFGEFGADTYSIWLYKGGARCNHKWVRRTYVSTEKNASLGNRNTNQISTGKARKFGYNPVNEKEVSMMPKDMPLKGFSPNNPNLPSDVR